MKSLSSLLSEASWRQESMSALRSDSENASLLDVMMTRFEQTSEC